MGIVFGITGCEEPKFLSLVASSARYQVRLYDPYFIAEAVGCSGGVGGEDQSFRVLAKYIGVFGTPENVSKAPMAMTAPVLMVPTSPQKMAMTAPVISSSSSVMSFVLPFHFKSMSEVPSPTDKRVRVRQIPTRVVAVRGFSGWYSDAEATKHREELRQQLVADELVRDGAALEWSVAQVSDCMLPFPPYVGPA